MNAVLSDVTEPDGIKSTVVIRGEFIGNMELIEKDG